MTFLKVLAAALFFFASAGAIAQTDYSYVNKVGERVTVFESKTHNYRLALESEAYTYVDFTDQVPDASFAGIRFMPNAFSLVIVGDLGAAPSAEQYADVVQVTMLEEMSARDDIEFTGHKDLGHVESGGMPFFQKVLYAKVGDKLITYVISTAVDGERAYQLMTFAINADEAAIKLEAQKMLDGFSVIDPAANRNIVVDTKNSIKDYRSTTFGYRFRARHKSWFRWSDLKETNDGADIGALTSLGYGAVMMPVCWQGDPPTHNAIYRVVMQQFSEDYPSDFIIEEHDIEKNGASGKLLVGLDTVEDEEYIYYQWIVANEHCAYTLAAWGPESGKNVQRDLARLWSDFRINDSATATTGTYVDVGEKKVNGHMLNALGLHYYEARGFRDAFRYFAHANELDPEDSVYVTNALRSLVEISAYQEAADWLEPRTSGFADDQVVQSWVAWLAYQTNDPARALPVYRDLFAGGYRDDDDFSVFMTLLADAAGWEELDVAFEQYTSEGVTDKTRLLQVQLLSRRGKHEEALLQLDQMIAGRPFNADLVYERMSVLDDMGNPTEVLRLAESLIDNGYRSLQSFYYKGDAEYQLRSYRAARESFEQALEFSPGNTNVRDYIEAIDLALGQGDVSTISVSIDPVALPKDIQKVFAANDVTTGESGYGADYLFRVSGYAYSGDDSVTETQYRKIRIIDDNGISQFSTLEFDYDPSFETLFVNSLIVRDTDGNVLGEGELSSYYITNNEDGYEASTEKTVHLPVPSLAPGVMIEAVVSKLTGVERGSFPLETIYLATDRPIAYSALFVTGDTTEIRFRSSSIPDPKRRNGALVWEVQKPVAYRWEPLQPYFDQILPWVQIGTTGDDWQAVGAEYLDKIRDKLDADKVAGQAARLVEGVKDRTRQIEILSRYVQDEIYYEAIEFGRRAYIPKTARETMRDRYGDCKDHSVLLYTMLESVGIDASLALVNLQQEVIPELPNTDQFNHMIVSVPVADGLLYIDATDKDMRLGALPPRSMAGNHALLLGDESQLVKIPDYESELTGITVERVVSPGTEGFIDVVETASFSGYQAAEMRGQLRDIETSEMQASLQRWIATRYTDAELTDHFIENVFDAQYDLIVEITYTLPLEDDGSFDVPGFLEAYYLEYDRVADRRFPFEFYYPLRVTATTSVEFPTGGRIDPVGSKPAQGESKFGNWSRKVSEQDDSWKIQFDYVASEARFAPDDYREFAEFQRNAVDAIEQPLVLQ